MSGISIFLLHDIGFRKQNCKNYYKYQSNILFCNTQYFLFYYLLKMSYSTSSSRTFDMVLQAAVSFAKIVADKIEKLCN